MSRTIQELQTAVEDLNKFKEKKHLLDSIIKGYEDQLATEKQKLEEHDQKLRRQTLLTANLDSEMHEKLKQLEESNRSNAHIASDLTSLLQTRERELQEANNNSASLLQQLETARKRILEMQDAFADAQWHKNQ